MPRRKLARRFEPRYGVSQVALDVESKYVGRELEDQLLQSTADLRKQLSKWNDLTTVAEAELQAKLETINDRERLALRCMLARDIWHIGKLYLSFLGSVPFPQSGGARSPIPEEVDETDRVRPVLSFKETLFE